MNTIFLKRENAKSIDLDEEGILYHENAFDKKYIANISAMAIWDIIDGKNTAKEIAKEIATACNVSLLDIEEDVYNQLTAFQELGLIDEVKRTT